MEILLPPTLQSSAAAYEELTGAMAVPNFCEDLLILDEEFSILQVTDAIKESIRSGNQRPGEKYIRAILQRWQVEGRNGKKKVENAVQWTDV